MTAEAAQRGVGGRLARALAVLVGAAAFGPLAPGAVAAALAVAGSFLSGTRSLQPLPIVAASTIAGAFLHGGEAAALLTGLALAVLLLWRGAIGPLAVTRTSAFAAVLVAAWLARSAPLRGALLFIGGFVVIAVVTARTLYRLALVWRILPQP